MFKFRARVDIGNPPAYVEGGSKQRLELSTILWIAPEAALNAFARAYPLIAFIEYIV
jgi:hypothetical protein